MPIPPCPNWRIGFPALVVAMALVAIELAILPPDAWIGHVVALRIAAVAGLGLIVVMYFRYGATPGPAAGKPASATSRTVPARPRRSLRYSSPHPDGR